MSHNHSPRWTVAMAFVSTFTALCALWVAVVQTSLTREADRQAVRPMLDWRVTQSENGVASIKLVNVGVGSAAISDVQVWLDGVSVGRAGRDACAALDLALRPEDPASQGWDCFTVGDTRSSTIYLRASEELEIFRSTPSVDGVSPPSLAGRVRISASYQSVYGEAFVLGDGP